MFRKIYSHLWIVAIVSLIVYCIIASIIKYGIVDVAKVLLVIIIFCVLIDSLIMWLLEKLYQPKEVAVDELCEKEKCDGKETDA